MSEAQVSQVGRPPVTLPIKLAYGFGSAAFGVKAQLMSLLLLFYNQIVGLPAHWVAIALSCTVVFDALWDPTIGQISDNWRSKWGRRHPFMYFSALPAAGSLVMLFNPPVGWSDGATVGYMLFMVILARSTISLYEVPATALTPELAPKYDERTRLLAYRYFFAAAATSGAAFFGYRLFLTKFEGPNGHMLPGQLNQAGYTPYAIAVGCVMIASIMIACLATHKFIPFLHQPPIRRPKTLQVIKEMMATLSNRNFLVVTLSALISGIGTGLGSGLSVYFSTYLWKLDSNALSIIVLGSLISSFLALFLAPIVSKALGKKIGCVTVMALSLAVSITPLTLRLLGIIPDSWIGSNTLVVFLLVDRIIAGALGTSGGIMVASMIADVVEESQVKTGRRSEGLLLSADNVLQKIVGGIAGIIPGLLLTFVGMPRKADPNTLDPEIMRHLALIYLPCTAAFSAIAITTLLLYRINRGAHEANLKKISETAATAEAAAEAELLTEGGAGASKPA